MVDEDVIVIPIFELKLLMSDLRYRYFVPSFDKSLFIIESEPYHIGQNTVIVGKTIRCSRSILTSVIDELESLISCREEEVGEMKLLLGTLKIGIGER